MQTKKKTSNSKPTLADLACRYALYEAAVQEPGPECQFMRDEFNSLRHREPFLLREDFCATAFLCREWVTQGDIYRAIGVDLDPVPLAWGREKLNAELNTDQQLRVSLLQGDACTISTPLVDIVHAGNFSYWLFRTREELKEYFTAARKALANDGIFFLDAYGGYQALRRGVDRKRTKDFTYFFESTAIDPITNHIRCNIHFRFRDGSRLQNAFRYEWRAWSLPELKDILREVGFSEVHIYWEGEDENGEPSGEYARATTATNDPVWVALIAALA